MEGNYSISDFENQNAKSSKKQLSERIRGLFYYSKLNHMTIFVAFRLSGVKNCFI